MTNCSKIHSSGEFQSYVMMSGASNGKMGEDQSRSFWPWIYLSEMVGVTSAKMAV